jgi:hypothetical protein
MLFLHRSPARLRSLPEPLSIAGGRLELLEAATTVTECDWMRRWMRRYGRARPRV